uniref:Cyanobacterial aminoacyl-tRNA synthetase CAAD domain-containing protein n=1 Tax=Brassica oleracea var. oleracea TaxID=109376 RepID=A0A0D3A3Y8_BRAOL
MGRSLIFSGSMSMRISQSSLPLTTPFSCRAVVTRDFRHGLLCSTISSNSSTTRLRTKAVLSDQKQHYPRIGAKTTGPISPAHLLQVVEAAAKTGAEVVMEAVNKPRNITYKGLSDLVTDTDKASETAILEVVKKNFSDHLILGEEGGIIGDSSSDYLWCIDPLDGTTNFAHGYPSFAVSVGVLYRGNPAAASVVEFVGGPMCWNTRTFSATAGTIFVFMHKHKSEILYHNIFFQQRASSSDETSKSIDTNELFNDLKEKWDGLENKTTVVIYGGGAIVAVWLSSILVGAINSVPLLPKVMELVGLGYTGWFVYRYLLYRYPSRYGVAFCKYQYSVKLWNHLWLYNKYKDKRSSLEILAFPCNQGTTDPITDFVCTRFKSEFPIFHKIEVNGENASPLYKFLKKGKCGDEIQWNFAKFLVDRQEWSSCRTSLLPKLLLFLHLSMILRSF